MSIFLITYLYQRIILLIVGAGGYYYYFYYNGGTTSKAKVVNTISGYGYKLKSNKSAEYKKEFSNLKEILKEDPVDEKKYAKSLTKLFILDFSPIMMQLIET